VKKDPSGSPAVCAACVDDNDTMAHHRPESALIDFRIFPGVSTDDSMDNILHKFRDLIIDYVTQDLPWRLCVHSI